MPRRRASDTAAVRSLQRESAERQELVAAPAVGRAAAAGQLARALVNRPAVLLVDEPTSALDSASGAAVIELIGRLTAEQDTATLLVTHDLQHLPRLDEGVHLVDGRVAAEVGVR